MSSECPYQQVLSTLLILTKYCFESIKYFSTFSMTPPFAFCPISLVSLLTHIAFTSNQGQPSGTQ